MLRRTMRCAAICDVRRRVASSVVSSVSYKVVAGVDLDDAADVDSIRELAATPRFDAFLRFAKCRGSLTLPRSDSARLQHKSDIGNDIGCGIGCGSRIYSGHDLPNNIRSAIHYSISSGNQNGTDTDNGIQHDSASMSATRERERAATARWTQPGPTQATPCWWRSGVGVVYWAL